MLKLKDSFSLNAKRTADSNDTWSKNRRSFCNQYISRKVYIPMCFVVCFLAHLSWKLKWAFRSSVVRRLSVCLSVCPSVCKLFTFSSSSPEPLGQFQLNLAQSILGWRGFKFVHMKGPPFSRKDNYEIVKIHWRNLKNLLLQNHWVNFNQTWHKVSLGEGDLNLFKWRAPPFSKGR